MALSTSEDKRGLGSSSTVLRGHEIDECIASVCSELDVPEQVEELVPAKLIQARPSPKLRELTASPHLARNPSCLMASIS